MTKFISILLLLLASEYAIAQKSIMLQGKILDKKSGEPLVGAVVYNKEFPTKGTTSNQDGYYSIQLQEGTQIIVCSYIGYITYESLWICTKTSRLISNYQKIHRCWMK